MTTPYQHRASRLSTGLPRTGSPIGRAFDAYRYASRPYIEGVGDLLPGENLAEAVLRDIRQRKAQQPIIQSE